MREKGEVHLLEPRLELQAEQRVKLVVLGVEDVVVQPAHLVDSAESCRRHIDVECFVQQITVELLLVHVGLPRPSRAASYCD